MQDVYGNQKRSGDFWVEEKGLRTEPKREEGEILVLLHLCLNN
jgi:hypothetical protein